MSIFYKKLPKNIPQILQFKQSSLADVRPFFKHHTKKRNMQKQSTPAWDALYRKTLILRMSPLLPQQVTPRQILLPNPLPALQHLPVI